MPNLKIALLSLALAAPLASGASFNCAKAASAVEKMVCADPELSRLDDYLAGSYQRAVERVGDKLAMREWQRSWLKSSALNDCKGSACLKLAYGTRVKLLDDAVKSPWNGLWVRQYKGKSDPSASEMVLIASADGGVMGEGRTASAKGGKGGPAARQFSAMGTLSGDTLVFKEEECEMSATLKGRMLMFSGTNRCGGIISFMGHYRRQ